MCSTSGGGDDSDSSDSNDSDSGNSDSDDSDSGDSGDSDGDDNNNSDNDSDSIPDTPPDQTNANHSRNHMYYRSGTCWFDVLLLNFIIDNLVIKILFCVHLIKSSDATGRAQSQRTLR